MDICKLGKRGLAFLMSLVMCISILPAEYRAKAAETVTEGTLDGTSLIPVDGTLITAATWTAKKKGTGTLKIDDGVATLSTTKTRNNVQTLTLEITVSKAVQMHFTATQSGKNCALSYTLDGGASQTLLSAKDTTGQDFTIEVSAGSHTVAWSEETTNTTAKTATLKNFSIIDPDSLRTVTVDVKGENETVDVSGVSATVDGSGSATVVCGESVTLKAVNSGAAEFVGWYDGDELLSNDASYSYTVESNKTIAAKFKAKEKLTLTLKIDGKGTVKVDGEAISNDGLIDVYQGTAYTLVAAPADDYTVFDGWYDSEARIETKDSYTYTPSESKILTAKFVARTMEGVPEWVTSVGTSATQPWTGDADGTLSSAKLITKKTTSTLYLKFAATEDSVLAFDYEVATRNSDGLSLTLESESGDSKSETYIGNNTKTSGTSVVTGNDMWSIAAGNYTLTASYNMTATCKTNQVKLENLMLVSGSKLKTLTVKTEGDQGFGAANATVQMNGSSWLTESETEKSASLIPGRAFTLTAVPEQNYIFDGWYAPGGETALSTDASYSMALSSDTGLEARFHKAKTVVVTPNLSGVTLKYNTTNKFTGTNGTVMENGASTELKEGTYYFQFSPDSDTVLTTATLNGTEVKGQLSNNVMIVNLNEETYGENLAIGAASKSSFDAVLSDPHITAWESYHISDATGSFTKGTDNPVWKYAGTSSGTPVIYSGVDYNTANYTISILALTIHAEADGDLLYFDYANAGQNDQMAVVDYDAYMSLDGETGKKGFGVLWNYYASDGHVSASSLFGNDAYSEPPKWLYVYANFSIYGNDLYGDESTFTRNYGKELDDFIFREQKSIELHAGNNRIAFISMKNTGAQSNKFGFYIKNISVSHEVKQANVTLSYDSAQGSVLVDGEADTTGTLASDLGDSHTFSATSKAGYLFEGWYDGDGKLLTHESTYTAVISADVTVKAKFADLSGVLPSGVAAKTEGSTWLVSDDTLYASNTGENSKETDAKLILTIPAGYRYFSFDVSHQGYFNKTNKAYDTDTDYMIERPIEYTAVSADGATPNGCNLYANINNVVDKTVAFAFEDTDVAHTVTVLYHRTSSANYAGNHSIVSKFRLTNDMPAAGIADSSTDALSKAFIGEVEGLSTSGDAKWYWDNKYDAVANGNPSEKTGGSASTSSLSFTLPAGTDKLYWDEMYNRVKDVCLEVYVGGNKVFDDNKHPSYGQNGYSGTMNDCVSDGTFVRREVTFSASSVPRTVEFRITNDRKNSLEHYGYGGFQTYWLKNISFKKLSAPADTFVSRNESDYTRISAAVTNLRFPTDQETRFMLATGPESGIENEEIHVALDGMDVSENIAKGMDQDWTYALSATGAQARTLSFYFTAPGYLPSDTYTVNLLPDASGQASTDWPSVAGVNAAAGAFGWTRNTSYQGKSVAYLPENTGKDSSDAVMAMSLPSPGQVTFSYRTSSEANYDKLIVTDAEGKVLMEASGEMTQWEEKTVSVTGTAGGEVIVNFIYHKDSGSSKGEDNAAIADVVFSGSEASLAVGVTEGSGSYGTAKRTDSGALYVGSTVKLAAAPANGGRFYGWYDAASGGTLLSREADYTYVVDKKIDAVYACFGAADAYQAAIGSTLYPKLKDALDAAGEGCTVTMIQDVLIGEDVTIPANVTLLVPCSGSDEGYSSTGYNYDNEKLYGNNDNSGKARYRKLTVGGNATLTVKGTLLINSVSGRPAAGHYDQDITGGYGQIALDGKIVVGGGGMLDNYGSITGSGTVKAQSGGTVSDLYVVKNWRGGTQAYAMYNNSIYPMNEYELHHIEVPIEIAYGATYTGFVKMFASGSYYQTRFPQVDSRNGLIRLKEGASAVKSYSGGRESYTITGGADFVSSTLNIVGIDLSTAENNFIYPINGIYDFALNGGEFAFAESFKFMPGATVTVGAGSKLKVNAGKKVVFYDSFHPNDIANTDNTQYSASRGPAALRLKGDASLENSGSLAGTVFVEDGAINGTGWSVTTQEANGYNSGARKLDFSLTLNEENGTGTKWNYDPVNHSIVFASADYTAVDAAIAEAKEKAGNDLDNAGYTEESRETLKKAVDAVVRGKRLDSQKTVDAYADAIQAATKGLMPVDFTITFSVPGGAAVDPAAKTVTYGKEIGTLPTPQRAGYNFDCWYFSGDENKVAVRENTIYQTAADATLEPKWTTGAYDITLDPAGGEFGNTSFIRQNDGKYKMTFTVEYEAITLPTPLRTGYTFKGWTGDNGTDPQMEVIIPARSMGSRSYTANWQVNTHTVQWMTTGDKVYKTTTNVNYGEAIVPPVTNPTHDGYRFDGWAEHPGTMPDEDVAIQAQWTSYLELLDDIGDISSDNLAQARKYYGKLNDVQRATYKSTEAFKVLYEAIKTHETAQVEKKAAEAVPAINSGTLAGIAQLKLNTGEGSGNNVLYVELTDMDKPAKDLLNVPFLKELFAYDGVSDVQIGETKINKTSQFQIMLEIAYATLAAESGFEGDHDGFVNWLQARQNEMTVGSLAGTSTLAYLVGETAEGIQISVPYEIYFYERGKEPTASRIVSIHFDTQGGSDITPVSKREGMPVSAPQEPARTGYSFCGWYENGDCTGASYVFKVMPTADLTLYAKWEARSFTVSFEGMDETITVTYDSVYGELPIPPERTGYIFEGWYLEEEKITQDSTVCLTQDTRLSAWWTPEVYKVALDANGGTMVLDANGGTVGETEVEAVYDGTYSLPTPTRAGYTFVGWYLENGTQVSNGETVSAASDLKLTAKWQVEGNTPYNVKHYLQDLDGEGYTLEKTELLTGAADTEATAKKETYPGFTLRQDSVLTGTIAGDGSLVISLYYDRDVYAVTWETGTGVKTERCLYETEPVAPDTDKPDDDSGSYTFIGWDKEILPVTGDVTYTALYGKSHEATVGETTWRTLALALKNAGQGNVVLLSENLVISEDITVPAGVTLLIPCKDGDTGYQDGRNYDNPGTTSAPSLYRTLIVDKGASLTINGTLLVNAVTGIAAAGHHDQVVTGGYGQINLEGDIIVNNGGILDCFGYIKGGGQVTANSGGTVGDLYVVRNWRGGSQALEMYGKSVYPMNQYDCHNIEAALRVNAGGSYTGLVKMYANDSYFFTRFPQIDQANGLFRLADADAYVVRTYDSAKDREHYAFTGGADFSRSTLNIVGMDLSTANYIYPMDGDMSFTLRDGSYAFAESYKFLPGSEVKVSGNASLGVQAGKTVVFYHEWNDPVNTDHTEYPSDRGAAVLRLDEGSVFQNEGTFAGDIEAGSASILSASNASWTVKTKEANGYYSAQPSSSLYTLELEHMLRINGKSDEESLSRYIDIAYKEVSAEGGKSGTISFEKKEDASKEGGEEQSRILGLLGRVEPASTEEETVGSTDLATAMKEVACDENVKGESSQTDNEGDTHGESVSIEMKFSLVKEEESNAEQQAIKEKMLEVLPSADPDIVSKQTDFMEINVERTVGEGKDSVTEKISDIRRVVEIPLRMNMTGRYSPRVFRYHDGKAENFIRLASRPQTGLMDRTYFVSGTGVNTVIYVYSQKFSTYAITTGERKSVNVLFDADGGLPCDAVAAYAGDDGNASIDYQVLQSRVTVKNGYKFDGWYQDGEKVQADLLIDSDVTLTAHWIAEIAETPGDLRNPGDTEASGSTAGSDNLTGAGDGSSGSLDASENSGSGSAGSSGGGGSGSAGGSSGGGSGSSGGSGGGGSGSSGGSGGGSNSAASDSGETASASEGTSPAATQTPTPEGERETAPAKDASSTPLLTPTPENNTAPAPSFSPAPGKATPTPTPAGSQVKSKAKDTITVKVNKRENTASFSIKTKRYSVSALKKKKRSFVIKVKDAKGKVLYSLSKKARKAGIRVSSKGKVKIPKGTSKGTYKVTVTVAGNAIYKKKVRKIKVKVKP